MLTLRSKPPKPIPADEKLLVRRKLPRLLIVMALAMLPLVTEAPLWVVPVVAMFCLWRLFGEWRGWWLPGRIVLALLTLLVMSAILLDFHTLNGLQAGVPFLMVMLGLKALEIRQLRDLYVLNLLCWFMLATALLQSQELLTVAYVIPALILVTASLLDLSAGAKGVPMRWGLKTSGWYLAQALPVALLAFVLFPRINGPLWSLPGASQGMTGLTETMEPGAISKLSQSDAVAFRVTFEGIPPLPWQRYWRGPVLSDFDGRRWSASNLFANHHPAEGDQRVAGELLRYTVTLEANAGRRLYGLDMVVPNSKGFPRIAGESAQQANDLQLLVRDPLVNRERYTLQSGLNYQFQLALPADLRRLNTLIPKEAAPEAQKLAGRWRRQFSEPEAIVNAALEMFRNEPYVYTLEPPLLRRDPVDQFLFETRRGFCEHFASSFVVLMRAAGLPARVVTGYQGGEMNGDYMIVRQLDAHAWAEVWMAGQGWVRVDPTAAVAPNRIELGLAESVEAPEGLPNFAYRTPSVLRNMRLRWDALQSGWYEFVLGYGQDSQRALLSAISPWLASWQGMLLTLVIVAMLFFSALTIWLLWRDRSGLEDPLARIWQQFQTRLARRGTQATAEMGPRELMRLAVHHHPRQAHEIRGIVSQYIRLRYGPPRAGDENGPVSELKRSVAGFRPEKFRPEKKLE